MKEKNKQVTQLTLNSKIGSFYASPIGHDVIFKVLMQLRSGRMFHINIR